jgi:ribosomal protein S18 acetylase RimI-like enzyme
MRGFYTARRLITATTMEIRAYQHDDEAAAAAVWYRSGREEYDYLPLFQALSQDEARRVFAEVIVPGAEIWVAVTVESRDAEEGYPQTEEVVGFLALRGSYIDRLYVDPSCQRLGAGGRLLAVARQRSSGGLELHTHQQNTRARAFYEKHGFRAVAFGLSPAPESVPDVEYHWRPAGG